MNNQQQNAMAADWTVDVHYPTWSGRVKSITAAARKPWLDYRRVVRPRCHVDEKGDANFVVRGLLTASAGLLLAHEILRHGRRRPINLWIDSPAGQIQSLAYLLPAIDTVACRRLVGAFVFRAYGPALVMARHCSAHLGMADSRVGLLACRMPLVTECDQQLSDEHQLDAVVFAEACRMVRRPIPSRAFVYLQECWINGEQAESFGAMDMYDGPKFTLQGLRRAFDD